MKVLLTTLLVSWMFIGFFAPTYAEPNNNDPSFREVVKDGEKTSSCELSIPVSKKLQES